MKPSILATLFLAAASTCALAQAGGGPLVDVAITVTGNPQVTVGFNAMFTVIVSNPGTQPITAADSINTGVTLTTAFTQITGTGSGWACHPIHDPSAIVCDRTGALPAGQSYPPLQLTAHANAPGNFQNCAHVSYMPGPGRPKEQALANNNTCFNFTVQPPVQACLTTNTGAPRFIVGMGIATSQAPALGLAQSDWSNKSAQAGGPSYGNPNHAAQIHTNCSQANGTPFHPGAYTCTYTAQPCQ